MIIVKKLVIMVHNHFSTLLFLACVFYLTSANSANVLPNKHADYMDPDLIIEGEIQKGDLVKVINILSRHGSAIDTVELYSPGGDVIEATRIGRLIRLLGLRTIIPSYDEEGSPFCGSRYLKCLQENKKDVKSQENCKLEWDKRNCTCTSACFLIYIAGVERFGNYVGVHRSYIDSSRLKEMDGSDAIFYTEKINRLVSNYYEEMGVSKNLTDKIKNIPSNEIYWLNEKELEEGIGGRTIYGYEEWLIAKCGTDPWPSVEYESYVLLDKRDKGPLNQTEKVRFDELNKMIGDYRGCKIDTDNEFREKSF